MWKEQRQRKAQSKAIEAFKEKGVEKPNKLELILSKAITPTFQNLDYMNNYIKTNIDSIGEKDKIYYITILKESLELFIDVNK